MVKKHQYQNIKEVQNILNRYKDTEKGFKLEVRGLVLQCSQTMYDPTDDVIYIYNGDLRIAMLLGEYYYDVFEETKEKVVSLDVIL